LAACTAHTSLGPAETGTLSPDAVVALTAKGPPGRAAVLGTTRTGDEVGVDGSVDFVSVGVTLGVEEEELLVVVDWDAVGPSAGLCSHPAKSENATASTEHVSAEPRVVGVVVAPGVARVGMVRPVCCSIAPPPSSAGGSTVRRPSPVH
jgi:hypothetical protein